MALLVNLRHLENDNLNLKGELSSEELDIDTRDEIVQVGPPLKYELEVQKVEDGVLAQGKFAMDLACKCVRCLRPFLYPLELETWARLLPLEGDDAVRVENDCVDLTPLLREDILLEFPQHPLCDPDCPGLPGVSSGGGSGSSSTEKGVAGSPAWNELNKLKLNDR